MPQDFAPVEENFESRMLIVFGGLPGTGKTKVAKALAQKLDAVYLRVDTIEQALRSSAVLKTDVGPAGYVVAYRLAEDNLRIGRVVVADSVNSLQVTRDGWLPVAEQASTRAAEVEFICSDAVEHRRRVETRRSDIEELKLRKGPFSKDSERSLPVSGNCRLDLRVTIDCRRESNWVLGSNGEVMGRFPCSSGKRNVMESWCDRSRSTSRKPPRRQRSKNASAT